MMKPMRRMLPLLGTLLVAACIEPADLGYHQPGKYIGKADPLIARTTTGDRSPGAELTSPVPAWA